MTIICFDGKTLAGDKRTNFGGKHATSRKVHKIGNLLVGAAGTVVLIQEMLNWIKEGRDPEAFPESCKDKDDAPVIMVIEDDKSISLYDFTPYPIRLENGKWAIGSGADCALMAMHLGLDAVKAVEETCKLDTNCGNGVDYVEFEDDIPF